MFSRAIRVLAATSILVVGSWAFAAADVLRVSGTVTPVSNRVEDLSVAVLEFELPALRQGVGLEVQSAVIDWDHAAITRSTTVRFKSFDATGLSSQGEARETQLREILGGEARSRGVFHPQDYARHGKGHLRIDVRDQIRAIVGRGGSRLQLVIATQDMPPADLGSGGPGGPVLVVRYGFLGSLKPAFSRTD